MKRTPALTVVASLLFLSACADHTVSGPMGAPAQGAMVANANAGLKLLPSGFGEKSYAAWRAHEGLPDSRGSADNALYFQKMTATTTFAAGVARIFGLEGRPLSDLVGLSWEHRIDGWCGAGAPRWSLIVSDESGNRGVIFLGCAAAFKSPGTDPTNWIRDSYPGPGGVPIADLTATGFTADFDPTDALTISQLLIVFDEGTDIPVNPGYVYLDNITVATSTNTTVFTGPMDNGSN